MTVTTLTEDERIELARVFATADWECCSRAEHDANVRIWDRLTERGIVDGTELDETNFRCSD